MPSTKSKPRRQRKWELGNDCIDQPPLRKRKGCDGPIWIPLHICGFVFTKADFIAYAKNHVPDNYDSRRDEWFHDELIEAYRRNNALKRIDSKLMPRHDSNIVPVHTLEGKLVECFQIGSNHNEKEMNEATDEKVISAYQKALDITRPPR